MISRIQPSGKPRLRSSRVEYSIFIPMLGRELTLGYFLFRQGIAIFCSQGAQFAFYFTPLNF